MNDLNEIQDRECIFMCNLSAGIGGLMAFTEGVYSIYEFSRGETAFGVNYALIALGTGIASKIIYNGVKVFKKNLKIKNNLETELTK